MANTKARSVVIKDQMWDTLRSLSARENRSMSDLLREALNDLFSKRQSKDYDPITDRFVGGR
jgi:Arc/MetJ-type ribon-helix-helix transcriptional regulator